MLKVILNAPHPIAPFNEPARDLRVHNTPLWLHQRNILAPFTTHELELKPGQRFPLGHDETLVYRDNLFFDEEYFRPYRPPIRPQVDSTWRIYGTTHTDRSPMWSRWSSICRRARSVTTMFQPTWLTRAATLYSRFRCGL